MLEEVFLIKRILAWSWNVSSRTVRTPKVMVFDSGIAANLCGLDVDALLDVGGSIGGLPEGFVASELSRQLTWCEQDVELFHYRTKDKAEVDIVLENARRKVVGIEVKAASTVRHEDFAGLQHLAGRVGDDFAAGYVLYTGKRHCRSVRSSELFRSVPYGRLLPE